MYKPFSIHSELLINSADLEYSSLRGLDGAELVLDWRKLEQITAGIYASKTDRPSYPLLTVPRLSLLGIWYRIGDLELAQTKFRDLLFRNLKLGGDVPKSITVGHFRQELVGHDLWAILFDEVTRQLEAKHIIMTERRINIIDATQVEAAQFSPQKYADKQPTCEL